MKSKKVYIGIVAVLISLGVVIASVFYIKANNKDVEVSQFNKNMVNEETKEAMQETEDVKKEDTDEEKMEEIQKEEEPEQEPEKTESKAEDNETVKETPKKVEQPKKEIVVTDISKTMYVNVNDSLNVRSGPDTSYARLGALRRADEVNITGETGEWYRISYNGGVGYIKACYLSDVKPEPIKQPEPETYTEPSSGESTVNNLIIINSRNNTLRYYVGGSLRKSYRCATGTSGTPTPQGKFSVFEKIVDRPYYKQNIPGGAPNNPLGPRWMQFKSGGYAIHGTNTDSSIGTNASHGCVRMHNSEVIELYSMVPMGTTVIVKNTSESDAQIAAGYGIHIE